LNVATEATEPLAASDDLKSDECFDRGLDMVDEKAKSGGSGRIGEVLRGFDWSATAIGPPESWPEAFSISLKIVLNAKQPMLIWWGNELTQFYNDDFLNIASPFLEKSNFGASGREHWPNISRVLAADIEHVLSGKGGISRERHLMQIVIENHSKHRYWTYSLSPIDEGDKVSGIFFVCRDETKDYEEFAALKSREIELARVQYVGKFGGLEVDLTSGFHNRRSPEYLAIHGLPPTALYETHENWVRRIHPEDRYRTEHTFIRAIGGDSDCKGYSIQYRIVRPSDGKIRWIHAKTEIERDQRGTAMRLVGVHTDVTDHVDVGMIERARFAAALDMLRCAVMLVDARGCILYMNRSAENILNEGSSIRVWDNTVKAVRPTAGQELSAALKLADHTDLVERNGWTVRLSKDDSLPVLAHIMPLTTTAFSNELGPQPTAAIFISASEDIHNNAELIASMFELTPAEMRLLSCLLSGRDRSEASAELRITAATVKTQLSAIFRKTGVNRQSELILLASRLAIPVHGHRLLSVLRQAEFLQAPPRTR
jgi:DNA-binding CsgD family transcriptional regulator/PAS domain-containing protein